jgi:hypothetical protein
MRKPPHFQKALAVLLISLIPASAWALEGRVVSMEPIRILHEDGSTEALKPRMVSFSLWDRGDVIALKEGARGLNAHSETCSCGNPTLGRLDAPFSIQAEVEGNPYEITIPAHRTLIYKTAYGLQIDVKNSHLGRVGVNSGKELILEDYRKGGELKSILITTLMQRVNQKGYPSAREIYSEIAAYELFSAELKKIKATLLLMPEKERPIDTLSGDVRPDIEELHRAFPEANFDRMTKRDFMEFFKTWAMNPGRTRERDRATGDETYLLRLMKPAGLSELEQEGLVELTLDSRIEGFLGLLSSGKSIADASFRDLYAAEYAKSWLESRRTSGTTRYLDTLRTRIRALDEPSRALLRDALMDETL